MQCCGDACQASKYRRAHSCLSKQLPTFLFQLRSYMALCRLMDSWSQLVLPATACRSPRQAVPAGSVFGELRLGYNVPVISKLKGKSILGAF